MLWRCLGLVSVLVCDILVLCYFGVAWVMSGSCLDGLVVVVVSDLFWCCLVACRGWPEDVSDHVSVFSR